MQALRKHRLIGLGTLAGLILAVSLLMNQLSADTSPSDPGTGREIGSTLEANGVSVTLEYVSTADDVTTLNVSYGSLDGSIVQLLGVPKITAASGSEQPLLSSRTVQQNENGTGMQMDFEFPAVPSDSDLHVDLGSVVRYANDVGSGELALPENFAETASNDNPVSIGDEITIGEGVHTVTTITHGDDRFGGSDAGQFFSIEIKPSNAAAARQVFAGGASEVLVEDDLGNRYTVVSVSTSFAPGDERIESQVIVVAGSVDSQATSLDLNASHYGKIVGPWTYQLTK